MTGNNVWLAPFTQPRLPATDEILRDLLRGRKSVTITPRPVDVRPGALDFYDRAAWSDAPGPVRVVVREVHHKAVRSLTHAEAVAAGYGSTIDLYLALQREVPGCDPEDIVTVLFHGKGFDPLSEQGLGL